MAQSIDHILAAAHTAGASDVHITVGIPPKMRVNGSLTTMEGEILSPQDTMEMALHIMNNRQKERFENEGDLDTSYEITGIGRFRVNIFKQRGAAAMAFRLVSEEIPSPEELGLPQSVIDLYKKKRGLILVTGPTGSGKSTTLAALVDRINKKREAHIITLEEPIEYVHEHKRSIVNQREVGLDTHSYANALRAALREDPDVILVGEMRDFETISVAVTAAETGHLVLSTLHTIGAANTVDRVIDVFPPHQQQQIRVQLANVLESVISLQLVPTIDKKDRIAAFEVMHANPAVRNLIREAKTHQLINVIQTGRHDGMITMDDALVQLYDECRIDRDTAIQYSQDPKSIMNKLF